MAIIMNQATLSYNGTTINSNITTGELLSALSATKTAVCSTYDEGSTVTYTISIVNTSLIPYTDLTITDDLGAYTFSTSTLYPLEYISGSIKYYSNGVLQAAPTVSTTAGLVISGLNVPANGNITLIYETEVTEFAPIALNSTITNTAIIENTLKSVLITVTETISVQSEPILTISKGMCPTTVSAGGEVTYTFTIENMGNQAATAGDNVVITDTFNPLLSSVSVTFDGTAWATPTNYSYNSATGVFSTVAGQITVPSATYSQDPITGAWVTTSGTAVLEVTGIIGGIS